MSARARWLPANALGGCLLLLLLPVAARAQGGFLTFEFEFSNPGARSLGFGGAFVALADDATSAYANPAGLVQLIDPEVSLEGRATAYSTDYTRSGRLDGLPSGLGIDTFPGLRLGTSQQTVGGVSFLSFVYPRERWAVAFYRHQLATFQFAGETQGLFAIPFPPDDGFRRELDRQLWTSYDFVSTGLAGAWRLGDSISLGLGIVQFDLSLEGTEQLYSFDSLDQFFAPNSFLPQRNVENIDFALDETDWGVTAGILWRLSAQWTLGGSFRPGPRVKRFSVRIVSGPAITDVPPGTLLFSTTSPIEFPDVIGLGAAYRSPDDHLTLSFEWDRVEYSSIIESLTFDNEANINDVDEIHFGAEYVFLATRPVVALRGGAWLEPDHRVEAPTAGPLDRALFRAGSDELHLSGGLGLAWRVFQLDLGFDVSETVDTVSLSSIYRW